MNWQLEVDSPELRQEIRAEVERLAPWYHSFELADWLEIGGAHDGGTVLPSIDALGFPADFSGKSVLDLGSNAGFYSFVARQRGAERVVGLELDPRYVEQARFLNGLLGLDVEFLVGDVQQLGPSLGRFDVVICSGLLYHIADPTNVLLAIASVCDETVLLESEFLLDPAVADMARFVEKAYRGYSSVWWIYGPRCMEGMVRAAGFASAEFKGFFIEPHGQLSPEGIPLGGRGLLIGRK